MEHHSYLMSYEVAFYIENAENMLIKDVKDTYLEMFETWIAEGGKPYPENIEVKKTLPAIEFNQYF